MNVWLLMRRMSWTYDYLSIEWHERMITIQHMLCTHAFSDGKLLLDRDPECLRRGLGSQSQGAASEYRIHAYSERWWLGSQSPMPGSEYPIHAYWEHNMSITHKQYSERENCGTQTYRLCRAVGDLARASIRMKMQHIMIMQGKVTMHHDVTMQTEINTWPD